MRINLSIPKNWQDFETLCSQLWKNMFGDQASHINGRQGQRQNGVDIYGKMPFDTGYTGVQCKGKNANYDSALTQAELEAECVKAQGFSPKLEHFVMATTSPRDVAIQRICREHTAANTYGFEVDTWSWDDIEEEVQCRPNLMETFYPQIKSAQLINTIKLSPFISIDKLHAFFNRPGLLTNQNRFIVNLLDNLMYELAINAFEHGKASSFSITAENEKLICCDNGMKFNTLDLISSGSTRGGGITLGKVKEIFQCDYSYNNEKKENILEITIPNGSVESDSSYTITMTADEVFGRVQAKELAYRELAKLPSSASKIILDVIGRFNPAISMVFTFIDAVMQSATPEQTVKIYLPNGTFYSEDIAKNYETDKRLTIIIKD